MRGHFFSRTFTVTSLWVRWRLKRPASRLFTQPLIRAQIIEHIKAPRHWPLCGEFTGHRWIPRTNDQFERGKCFHLMTSSWLWSFCFNEKCWMITLFSRSNKFGFRWYKIGLWSNIVIVCQLQLRTYAWYSEADFHIYIHYKFWSIKSCVNIGAYSAL